MIKKIILVFILMFVFLNIVQAEEIEKNVKAEILEIKREYQGNINVNIIKLKILEGKYNGQEVIYEYIPIEYSENNYELKKGNKVLINIQHSNSGELKINIIDIFRFEYIKILGIIFLICVVIFGGMKGILSVTSLGVTAIILIKFMIPLIVKGHSPIAVSMIATVFIILISFILIAGFTKKSLVAIIGTVGGTIIAGILANIFTKLCSITGIISEEVSFLIKFADMAIDFKGLYLSGVLIGVIGVVMDVSMSITSVIFELKMQNSKASFLSLLGSGLKVGRDIMATMINTLILAYVGSAMPLLLVFHFMKMPIYSLLNKEIVAVEIIRSLCGSIGLILTIPLTSLIASIMATDIAHKKRNKYKLYKY